MERDEQPIQCMGVIMLGAGPVDNGTDSDDTVLLVHGPTLRTVPLRYGIPYYTAGNGTNGNNGKSRVRIRCGSAECFKRERGATARSNANGHLVWRQGRHAVGPQKPERERESKGHPGCCMLPQVWRLARRGHSVSSGSGPPRVQVIVQKVALALF